MAVGLLFHLTGYLIALVLSALLGLLMFSINYVDGRAGGNGLFAIVPFVSFTFMSLWNLYLVSGDKIRCSQRMPVIDRAALLMSFFCALALVPNTFGTLGVILSSRYRHDLAGDGFPWWSIVLFEISNVLILLRGRMVYIKHVRVG